MDVIDCLTLLGHKILLVVMDELEHFTAFSTWMRFQIDRLNSSSQEKHELTEKEATMDNAKVLTYLQRYLMHSPLHTFFDEIDKEDHANDWKRTEDAPRLLDLLDAQLKKHETGHKAMKALPHVEFLVDLADFWSNRIFKDIAEAKKRSVRLGKPVRLTIGRKIDNFDMRMCEEGSNVTKNCSPALDTRFANGHQEATVYAALASKESSSRGMLDSPRRFLSFGLTDSSSLYLSSWPRDYQRHQQQPSRRIMLHRSRKSQSHRSRVSGRPTSHIIMQQCWCVLMSNHDPILLGANLQYSR